MVSTTTDAASLRLTASGQWQTTRNGWRLFAPAVAADEDAYFASLEMMSVDCVVAAVGCDDEKPDYDDSSYVVAAVSAVALQRIVAAFQGSSHGERNTAFYSVA